MSISNRMLHAAALISSIHSSSPLVGRDVKFNLPDQSIGKVISKTSALDILELRGGAGLLSLEASSKIASAVWLLQSLYMMMLPRKTFEAFKISNPDAVSLWLGKGNAEFCLAMGITSALLVFDRTSNSNKAIGAGMLTFVLGNIQTVLKNTPREIGIPDALAGQWFNLLLNAFVATALLGDASYAGAALKCWLAFMAIVGTLLIVSPETVAKIWKIQDGDISSLTRMMSENAAGMGVLFGSLALGKNPTPAVGYASLAQSTFGLVFFLPGIFSTAHGDDANKSGEERQD